MKTRLRFYLSAGMVIVGAATFVGTSFTPVSHGQEPSHGQETVPKVSPEQPMSVWMAKKIEYSKAILEALTAGRYDDIEKHAEQMRLIGKVEGFVRGRSPSYKTHLQTFDLATRELKRQAAAKNIEGATLAFHQLTTSCVTCHQTLRETPTLEP